MPPGSQADWRAPPLFLYGLLRPGERYWADLAPAVLARRAARVRGRLFQHASGQYPMLEAGGDAWVHGDLVDVEDTPVVQRLVFMELTAGYEARWVEAFPTDASAVAAIAFCWPWGATHRGAPIPSGDWQRR